MERMCVCVGGGGWWNEKRERKTMRNGERERDIDARAQEFARAHAAGSAPKRSARPSKASHGNARGKLAARLSARARKRRPRRAGARTSPRHSAACGRAGGGGGGGKTAMCGAAGWHRLARGTADDSEPPSAGLTPVSRALRAAGRHSRHGRRLHAIARHRLRPVSSMHRSWSRSC